MLRTILARLCLSRADARAWALYDWANSAMYTVVVTAVYPVWYRSTLAADLDDDAKRTTFAWTTTLALVLAALASPLLGAIADRAGAKKRFFAAFLALGAGCCAGLAALEPGQWLFGCALFFGANLGAVGSFVYYDAMLVDVAEPGDYDTLSTTGYALGYLGGGVALALVAALILAGSEPGAGFDADFAIRAGFLLVAAWWVAFSVPLLLRVKETRRRPAGGGLREGVRDLLGLWRELRGRRDAWLFLLAFFAYNDGIGTIIRMATSFGEEKGLSTADMLGAILLVQVVGIPATLLFGRLAGLVGPKAALHCAIAAYILAALQARGLEDADDFMLLALLVGLVQGGAQALSRSLYASLVPADRQAEYFGLFATLEKFAGILGPLGFALLPSTDAALLSVVGFFVLGGVLLAFVDVERGRAAVRHAPAPCDGRDRS
ncbi:MAG: MFS transporter [Planctomycetia bacterium]